MGLQIHQVDAFTNQPFRGNPAAVCILPAAGEEKWMQLVAREMNLAETAFLYKMADGYSLRWFTPVVEVDLCGHATLASAHILWETNTIKPDEEARFHTRSGLLTAARRGDLIELNFPVKRSEPVTPPERLEEALGAKGKYIGKTQFDYLLELESAAAVRALQPDYTLLKKLPVRGIIVTSADETGEYDFVSRFFAPGVGVDEDPVTGSAHCSLAPYWQQRLGKDSFTAYQASARGGVVRLRIADDRVYLSGHAVTVMRGELMVDDDL